MNNEKDIDDLMDKFTESAIKNLRAEDNFISVMIAVVVFLIICSFIVEISNTGKTRDALYAECLTTDYDKFQCYSMIYGDK